MATIIAVFAVISAAIADEAIRIGAIISKTGPAGFLGEPQEITLKHYVEQINKNGGVLGRPIKLIIYDDASDPNNARTFATRLIESDEVVATIGTSTTGGTLAMMQLFEDAKIPLISLAAGIEIVEPVRPYIFKTPHTDRMVCAKIIADMKARRFSRIALINGTDGVGRSMRKECTSFAQAHGLTIVVDESFHPKDVDMTPQLTKIKNTERLDAVFVGGFGQPLSIVTRNYSQLGVKASQYHSHGSASKAYIELAGPASEGVRLPGPLLLIADQLPAEDPLKSAATAYAKTMRELTGKDASTFGGYSYDALLLITDAIKRAGSAKPGAIRDALEMTKNLPGVTGLFTMSAKDHLGINENSLYMVDVKDGKWARAK